MADSKKTKKSNKDILQVPKGTRDITGDTFYRMQGFYEKAQEIAVYYGFSGISTPIMEHTEIFLKGLDADDDVIKEMYSLTTKGGDSLALRPEGTAPIMRSYIEQGMGSLPQPIFLYYLGPYFRHEKPQKGRYRQLHQFGLEIIGSPKAVLDAIIIQTGYQILKESGREITVKLNTLGNPENRKEYVKLLKSYYKKNFKNLGTEDQKRFDSNPLRILDSKDPKTVEVNQDAPTLISSLNPESKKHFKKVLEYLDAGEVPYELDHALVRGLDYYSHTVFEYFTVLEEESDKQLALGGGGRYDGLAKEMGHNKDVPAVGLALGVDRILDIAKEESYSPKIKKKPKFYFIQLGFEAKAQAFGIIETLRERKIAIKHSLSKDGLATQLANAEKLNIPYVLIFGQKEAIDKTVIVRNMETRKQDTIKIDDLKEYIKKLK